MSDAWGYQVTHSPLTFSLPVSSIHTRGPPRAASAVLNTPNFGRQIEILEELLTEVGL